MQKTIQIHKGRGLYGLLLKRLEDLKKSSRFDYIRYSDFYNKICRNFSVDKTTARELLFLLSEFGFVEVEKRGFKLNY